MTTTLPLLNEVPELRDEDDKSRQKALEPLPLLDELPELRGRVSRWSVEDYERLVNSGLAPKRGELIRGIIIDKMPKSALHIILVKRLYDWLVFLGLAGYVVFQEGGLRLSDSVPEPDVCIVPGREEDYGTLSPGQAELVVEVSVSSVAADRAYASLYAKANIPEYWIILAEARRVEVRRDPVGGAYQTLRVYERHETLACGSVPGVELPLSHLFR